MKYISLTVLVLQTSIHVLILKVSRTPFLEDGSLYISSTAVVLSELLKFILSLMMLTKNMKRKPDFSLKSLFLEVAGPDSDWIKMAVPATLYVVQNNLQYVGATELDAATFQITSQMKIITTALFSVWMLQKNLNLAQWISVFLLSIGIALVQLSNTDKIEERSSFTKLYGVTAVTVACVISGLAGVYFEKVLKGTQCSIWTRNVQLSFLSLIPAFFIGVLIKDGDAVSVNGFFYGYNEWTVYAIVCQAAGGLLVAVVIKYADNILKGFAASISIVLSCAASVFLFNFRLTPIFLLGSSIVLISTLLYSRTEKCKNSNLPQYLSLENSVNK
jgi:UDP-sugar transporter A1/2/3